MFSSGDLYVYFASAANETGAHLASGNVSLNQGNFNAAMRYFELSIQAAPTNVLPQLGKTYILMLERGVAVANQYLQRLHLDRVKVTTLPPIYFLYFGMLLEKAGNIHEAKEQYMHAMVFGGRARAWAVALNGGVQLNRLSTAEENRQIAQPIARLQNTLTNEENKTVEDCCMLALAQSATGQDVLAAATCQTLLATFPPYEIPHYLQKDFLKLLQHLCALNSVFAIKPKNPEHAETIQKQLAVMAKYFSVSLRGTISPSQTLELRYPGLHKAPTKERPNIQCDEGNRFITRL